MLVALAFSTLQLVRFSASGPRRSPVPSTSHVHEFPIFGTYGRLTFWADPDSAKTAAMTVAADLRKLHNMINLFDENSELSRLNAAAAFGEFTCSERLWDILGQCREAHRETNGAFDVTVGPLMRLWGFHESRTTLPTAQDVSDCLEAVGLDKVIFEELRRTVRFTHPSTYIDLGGIAKGLALDRAVKIARGLDVRCGLIDLGGNVFCLEEPPPGKYAYSIGIRDPFHNDMLLNTVKIINSAVGTSGNYERMVQLGSKAVTHIVDPRTGYPVDHAASVTVVTPQGIDSDVFSTAIFVDGEAAAKHLVTTRRRTSVLRVELSPEGKSVLHRHGWLWKEIKR